MLTGQRAFDGQGVSETLARVLEREPDWAKLPATLSPALRTYQTMPAERSQTAGAGHRRRPAGAGGRVRDGSPQTAAPAVVAGWRRVALAGVAAIIASGAIIGTLVWLPRAGLSRCRRLSPAGPPAGAAALSIDWNERDLAITPDGSASFTSATKARRSSSARSTPSRRWRVHRKSGRAVRFSRWTVDRLRDGLGVLKKVAVAGGPAVTLATMDTAGSSGATWGPDDTIIVATNSVDTGLQRVSAAGGPLTVLTRPDRAQGEADHPGPRCCPAAGRFVHDHVADGRPRCRTSGRPGSPDRGRRILVSGGSHAHYVSSAAISSTRRPARCVRCRSTWPVSKREGRL